MDKKETFAGEIAKRLPMERLYDDLLHPALSTAGEGLQGVTKLALAPISILVWGYDQAAEWLQKELPGYFERKKIKKEKIVTPDEAIAVPTIEALRYNLKKEELRNMFINLLGASMNSDDNDAHPAFVNIIKQLSPDESKILDYLYSDNMQPMIKKRMKLEGQTGGVDITPFFSDIGDMANCQYPDKFSEYLDNLRRLGLVEVHHDRYLTDETFYDKLRKNPKFPQYEGKGAKNIIEQKGFYELTEFGKVFCRVCIS